MKILYSCLSKSWGGMEMVTLTGLQQLLKRGIHVELLCTADSRIHIEANNLGIILHPVKAGSYIHPFSSLRMAFIIKKINFDIIHTHSSKDLWVIVPSLQLLRRKIPLVLTKHIGSFVIKKDFLHKRLYKYVTKAIAISSVIKKNLIDTTPLKEEQIVLIPNGVDTEKFNPEIADGSGIKKEFRIDQNKLLIGMMARFSPGKGHEEFLHSAVELNKKHNNLYFLIIGEASRGEHQYESEIKSLAEKLNINNIIFTGYRNDIPELLAALDIFVFPSRAEAFGIALIEAMAMEKPTVCSASDGILDIAVDGYTSFMFEKENIADLEEGINKLINNPDLRKAFSKAARKRVLENFNINLVTDRVCSLYEQLIKN
ncbi:MAG TPA: glycosyltransferase family 4 protein [Ignavibacteriaceae bacterium]|nr:glycosyltransferase family 4 protein [Ignavibacteriaceae bacterium]